MKNRLSHLDGLRGLAILLVVGYHTFARWPEVMPFGYAYAEVNVYKFGWLGVQLFFLISGYVITMSVERYPNFYVFFGKRWLRLFPAMLVITIFIYSTAAFLPDRPTGAPTLINTIPGLIFVEPYWLQRIFGISIHSLEGAFWSIYVEVKFYVFVAVFYYLFRQRNLYYYLFAAFILAKVFDILNQHSNSSLVYGLETLTYHGSFEHFGWFAAGTASYYHHRTKQIKWLYLGIFAALVSCLFYLSQSIDAFLGAIVIVTLFFTVNEIGLLKKIMSNSIFLYFGFISYPLYLVHENMLVAITIQLHTLLPFRSTVEYLLPAFATVVFIAYIVARFIEPFAHRKIK